MSRPKRKRLVTHPPIMEGFKPFGVPISYLEPVFLLYEEYEAIRLLDYQGLTQLEAGKEMGVSRPTLTRIYEKARCSIARAFVEGKAIFIEGGDFHSDEFWYRCESCFKVLISDHDLSKCCYCHSGNIKQLAAKDAKMKQQHFEDQPGCCICPRCNIKIEHHPGIPCRENLCPQCGKKMLRENSYHHQLYLRKQGEKNENSNPQ